MSKEHKWAPPLIRKAASASVWGDTHYNHRRYQSEPKDGKRREEKWFEKREEKRLKRPSGSQTDGEKHFKGWSEGENNNWAGMSFQQGKCQTYSNLREEIECTPAGAWL